MRLNLLSFGPPCTGVRGALIALGIIWAFSVLIAIPTAVNFDIIDNNNNHHNNTPITRLWMTTTTTTMMMMRRRRRTIMRTIITPATTLTTLT